VCSVMQFNGVTIRNDRDMTNEGHHFTERLLESGGRNDKGITAAVRRAEVPFIIVADRRTKCRKNLVCVYLSQKTVPTNIGGLHKSKVFLDLTVLLANASKYPPLPCYYCE
jgi:hypothetical protein